MKTLLALILLALALAALLIYLAVQEGEECKRAGGHMVESGMMPITNVIGKSIVINWIPTYRCEMPCKPTEGNK